MPRRPADQGAPHIVTAKRYDVVAIGNAIVDVIAPCADAFLVENGLTKGAMMLVDARQSAALYARMQQAVAALARGHSVTETALDAGYQSPSAFIAAFKRTFGVTPSRYRAKT